MTLNSELIDSLRKNSRSVVRELGLLGDEYNRLGVTLVERHLMIELGTQIFPDVSEVARLLLLEKSTASRLVASLVKKKLVDYKIDEKDKRRRYLQLTKKGEKQLEIIKVSAQKQVNDALVTLSEEEVSTVLKGMEYYAKGLKRARLRREFLIGGLIAQDNIAIAQLIVAVLEEYNCNRPGFASQDAELNSMYESYKKPGHAYFVVRHGSRVMGGAGIAPLEGAKKNVCELRKMYLASEARGLGLGDLLLERCLEKALELGYTTCYLETTENMIHAHNLYLRHGFLKIPKRLGNTGHFGCNYFFEKSLKPS